MVPSEWELNVKKKKKKEGCSVKQTALFSVFSKLWRNPSFSETVDINFDMCMSYRWLFHATA